MFIQYLNLANTFSNALSIYFSDAYNSFNFVQLRVGRATVWVRILLTHSLFRKVSNHWKQKGGKDERWFWIDYNTGSNHCCKKVYDDQFPGFFSTFFEIAIGIRPIRNRICNQSNSQESNRYSMPTTCKEGAYPNQSWSNNKKHQKSNHQVIFPILIDRDFLFTRNMRHFQKEISSKITFTKYRSSKLFLLQFVSEIENKHFHGNILHS